MDPFVFLQVVAVLPAFVPPIQRADARVAFELAHRIAPLDAWSVGCAALAVWCSSDRESYERLADEITALTRFARASGGVADGPDMVRHASAILVELTDKYGGPPVGLVAAYRDALATTSARPPAVAAPERARRKAERTPEAMFRAQLVDRVPRSAARPVAHCGPCGRKRVFMSLGDAGGWRCLTCGGDDR